MIKKTSLNYASEYECSKLPKVEGPSQTNIEIQTQMQMQIQIQIQSGASSLAKHGGAYFSAVYGSIQDPIAAPGLFDIQVP